MLIRSRKEPMDSNAMIKRHIFRASKGHPHRTEHSSISKLFIEPIRQTVNIRASNYGALFYPAHTHTRTYSLWCTVEANLSCCPDPPTDVRKYLDVCGSDLTCQLNLSSLPLAFHRSVDSFMPVCASETRIICCSYGMRLTNDWLLNLTLKVQLPSRT